MAKLFNRAKMTTTTTGSGTVTLSSASNGFQSFADAGVSDGDVVQYVIEDGVNFEIGTGSYSSSGTSLTRTPSESSNSNNAISLSGNATVSITAVADDLNRLQHAGSDKVTVSSTGATVTGNLAVTGTVDGRDVASDGTKLDGIEAGADVTDTANVTAAGALMDSEVTNLAEVKSFSSADYATAAQGTAADAALPKAGGTMTGAITFATGQTFDGRDVSADGTKLDGIESGADVTDTANVTAAGALMDSEITNLAQVKAFDSSDYATAAQGTTADAALPKAGGTMTGSIRLDQDNLSASGGTLTIDLDAANNFKITMSASTTFAFSNVSAGRGGNLIIVQNATGGYSFTLPAACKTPVNGASIVQATNANEISILSYYVVDSSNILVNYIGDFA